MGHFAKINQLRIVVDVQVGTEEYFEGQSGSWIQTWKDGSYRKNFAGLGFTYDYFRDAFIPPKFYNSWVLNETTCQWEAPIPEPNDGESYVWDETIENWVLAVPQPGQ